MANIRIDSRKQTAAYNKLRQEIHEGMATIEKETPFTVCALVIGTVQEATLKAAAPNLAAGESITAIEKRPVSVLEGSWLLFTCGSDKSTEG